MLTYQGTGENYIIGCYKIVFTKYYSRNQIKKNGKGRECGKCGGELPVGFGRGSCNLKTRDH